MTSLNFAAVDLGAESGRVMRATFDGRTLQLKEAHRFPNVPVRVLNSLHWDPLRLFAEIKHGLTQCAQGSQLDGIGLDTWGVDFALLGRDDELLGNPFHHRDARTNGMMEKTFQRVSREEIFERTGIQFISINTLYQLAAMVENKAPALEAAQTFLTMPDLFNFWLSGAKVCEFSNATTTQLYDQRAKGWAESLIFNLDLPSRIFPQVVPPATVLGTLLPTVAEELGITSAKVIAPACHDTGSAVAAVPTLAKHFAYISSGTWSLVGTEIESPLITPQSLTYNFTNEGGVANTARLLKNVMGLWLLQECRRAWAHEGHDYTYAQLMQMAESAPPFVSVIDPDYAEFLPPGDMPTRLRDFCARTHQPVPATHAAVARCIFESLALKYRWVIEKLEIMLEKKFEVIHVVGGGSQNALLCQLTADAAQRVVIAGPVEATALGNAGVQAMALGHLSSLAEMRQVIRDSVELITYEPRSVAAWDEVYGRMIQLVK